MVFCRYFHLFSDLVFFRVVAVCASLLVLANANGAFTRQLTVDIDHPGMVPLDIFCWYYHSGCVRERLLSGKLTEIFDSITRGLKAVL
jgi:hypothetical protein